MMRRRYKNRSVKKRKCIAKAYLTVENRVLLNIYANFRHVYLESKNRYEIVEVNTSVFNYKG